MPECPKRKRCSRLHCTAPWAGQNMLGATLKLTAVRTALGQLPHARALVTSVATLAGGAGGAALICENEPEAELTRCSGGNGIADHGVQELHSLRLNAAQVHAPAKQLHLPVHPANEAKSRCRGQCCSVACTSGGGGPGRREVACSVHAPKPPDGDKRRMRHNSECRCCTGPFAVAAAVTAVAR